MTASEFAFLALGLVLGVASGSALVMVLGSRPPAREVRLTVGHDAIPRRAATLSSDAFVTATAEPARGGPADRRHLDRDLPPADPPPLARFSLGSGPAPTAVMASISRTPVPFGAVNPFAARTPAPSAGSIMPERDPALDALRVQAALAAERLYRPGLPTATGLLEAHDDILPAAAPTAASLPENHPARRALSGERPGSDADRDGREDADDPSQPGRLDPGAPAIMRILRGDHQALFATTAVLAADDDAERRPWQAAIMGLADALASRAINAGWLDFPVGNPFWDTFTTEQCRAIAAALAGCGHRFDGVDGWQDGRIPNYRDLTDAVAAAGLEPRRIRAWPTQEEIGRLYREVTVAADELLTASAPDLECEAVQALVGAGDADRARLWTAWDRVRSAFLEPVAAG